MQGTGNINYSLNKNDFYKVISGGTMLFIPFYYILIIFSILYLYTIRITQYYFPNSKYKFNENAPHYFNSITYNSPFNIMKTETLNIGENKFIGLSSLSYLMIIISYVITLIIILQGLIRNFIYSIYSSVIQINPLNNPYNNPNNITKTKTLPYTSIMSNYIGIISLGIIFLVPFSIPFIINFLKFDNYDIKHNTWFSYLLCFLIFFPFIIILLFYSLFNSKLSIFANLYTFLNQQDFSFVDFIYNNFNFKFLSILPFLFVIFIYCYYTFEYVQYKYNLKEGLIVYGILFGIIFVFIPIILLFFGLNQIFSQKIYNNQTNDIIQNIQQNGISGLYDLLVKYNYPCFNK